MPNLTTNFIQTKIKPPEKGKVEYYRDSKLIGIRAQGQGKEHDLLCGKENQWEESPGDDW